MVDALLVDVQGAWNRRREAEGLPVYVLEALDRDGRAPDVAHPKSGSVDAGVPVVLRGTAAALAEWATGRGSRGVLTAEGDLPPAAPRWL